MNDMMISCLPPTKFLSNLLPVRDAILNEMPKGVTFSRIPVDPDSESEMYPGVVREFQSLSPGFAWFITSQKTGSENVCIQPNICSVEGDAGMDDNFSPSEYSGGKRKKKVKEKEKDESTSQKAQVDPPFDWARCEISVVVKARLKDDPFVDHQDNALECAAKQGRSSCGQISSYVKEQSTRQHRVRIYQLLILGHSARLLCYDRSGYVVSQRFDFHQEPEILAQFLWRYFKSNRTTRGWDTTVVLAEQHEVAAFENAITSFLKTVEDLSSGDDTANTDDGVHGRFICKEFHRTLDSAYPTYKILVSSNEYSANLIVRRPFVEPLSLYGRCTRSYLAYDVEQSAIVFFKDTWRTNHTGRDSEAEIYMTLKEKHVGNIPNVLYAGDVIGDDGEVQKSYVDEYSVMDHKTWSQKPCLPLRSHVHSRIIQDLAYPLWSVRGTRELVQVLRDALIVIQNARAAGILHRDISVGNVMITKDGRGILNDWDHSYRITSNSTDKHSNINRPPFRTGTWQFMSCRIPKNPQANHDVLDDVESVFWVLLFIALLWFKHRLGYITFDMFDQENVRRRPNLRPQVVGGGDKLCFLYMDEASDLQFESAPLDTLVVQLANDLSRLYGFKGSKETEEYKTIRGQCGVEKVIQRFDEALARHDWPQGPERVKEEQYPRQSRNATTKEIHQNTIVSAYGRWVENKSGDVDLSPVLGHTPSESRSTQNISAQAGERGGPLTRSKATARAADMSPPPPVDSQPSTFTRNARRRREVSPKQLSQDPGDQDLPSRGTSSRRRGRAPSRGMSDGQSYVPSSGRGLRRKRSTSKEPEAEASTSRRKQSRATSQEKKGGRGGKRRRT
ncbi:uncharacterized protein PHACADRAFT_210029 [Phanerochaete carnosa HHB-10118-sp]|uniref:Fungal-type protein kinase domain-containing protein n=1 Tax=Phanerochaete carnosa (strain HHB-10118-sp) TaxID=650164 RepID=K5UVY6_PHACS|nr:uncharacterized protein PHACADRAFT_210029 [Phanerochaete carnosa HHB-10118-sp]EKM54211.1 hypothetical protein PHACADRAFT_210029 [Phanerochaete carnosa HHB-10118-sp]